MESTDRTVNFFLGSKEMKQLDNETATNKSELYIIIQNDKLQSEVMSLREQNSKLQHNFEELETDSDKMDESVRYLRNLNKNLVVLRTEDSQVNKEYNVGIFKTVKNIYKINGIRGFYSGYFTGIAKVTPQSGITFMVYELCKKYIIENKVI